MSLKQLWALLNEFWFSNGSPIPVALLRIFIGILTLAFCWGTAPEIGTFFGLSAVVSPQTSIAWWQTPTLNLFGSLPVDMLLSLVALAATFLTLGLFSRVSAFAVYLLLMSLQSQNYFVLYNIIQLLMLMSLLLSFSQCGNALSLDRIIEIWIGKSKFGPAKPGSIVAQRLIQAQIALIYWSAFSSKLHGKEWMDGTAIWYVTHSNLFQPIHPLLPNCLGQLWISQLFSYSTLLVEPILFTLIWIKELRYWILLLGLGFHAGMELTLCIPLLQWIMISSYVTFIDAADLSKVANIIRSPLRKIPGLPVLVKCKDDRIAETIRRLDIFKLVQLSVSE